MSRKDEARLVTAIMDEFANAEGAQSDEMQKHRQQAMRYYQGKPRGDEQENRSQVISQDLASSVNATLALMRGMLIEECSVTFEAEGPDDQALAQAESDICADVVYKDNAGKRRLMTSIKDGLLSRQAVVHVFAEEVADGENEIRLRSVPSENVSYQSAYEGDLQEIRFFAEMMPYTRSDLVEMGCDKRKVAKLSDRSSSAWETTSQERDVKVRGHYTAPEREGDIVRCQWCYIKIDLDGDKITERYRVLYADNTVLMYEPWDVVPYAVGSPFLTPHRLTGESMHDRLKQTQDTNTSLQRQLIDNTAIVNNGRYIYDPSRVNESDILAPEAGGGIRARDPNAVVPLMVADVTPGILAGLEFFRRKRSEIAGAALDMASADAQLMNKSATQASIDKSNSELITSLIAHNLAETLVRDLFMLVRHYLRNYATRDYQARIAGQSMWIDPKTWQPRRRILVKAGKSPGEKAQMAQALQGHVMLQAQAMQLGMNGILADANTIYRTQMEYLKLMGLEDVEPFAIDPSSPQAQQAMQAQAQREKQMAEMQQRMADIQRQLETAKIAEDARQADQEIRFKYDELAAETETEMAKVTANGQLELERQSRDIRARTDGVGEGNAGNREGAET